MFSTEAATAPGDTDFYKMEMKTDWFFKGFFPGHILEVGGRFGVVSPYGNSDRPPIFERWFLGGLYSLRGFRYRQVGPMDQFGEPLGGESYFYGSAEYSIPIIKYVRFLLFYDIGNVFADAYSFGSGRGGRCTATITASAWRFFCRCRAAFPCAFTTACPSSMMPMSVEAAMCRSALATSTISKHL